ncbi:hypothetical protein PMAYCL1PPCAC_03780, partial [Pristionchus mayeri]
LIIVVKSSFRDMDAEADYEMITSAANHSVMCGHPIKTIAYANLLFLSILCPGLSIMFYCLSIVHPRHADVFIQMILEAAVASLIPMPFLIIGFIAVVKENKTLAFIFALCVVG